MCFKKVVRVLGKGETQNKNVPNALGGLEETLRGLQRHISLLALTFVIISDFEDKEQVGKNIIKVAKEVEQPIEIEQLAIFFVSTG